MKDTCKACKMYVECKPVFYINPRIGQRDIMIVADRPTAKETNIKFNDKDLEKNLSRSKAGNIKLLLLTLKSLDIDLNRVYITNLVKTHTTEKLLKADIIKSCLPLLQTEIDMIKPKLIIGLGNEASKIITGSRKALSKIRGYINYNEKYGCCVMSTYSPKQLLAASKFFPDYITDWKKFLYTYEQVKTCKNKYWIEKYVNAMYKDVPNVVELSSSQTAIKTLEALKAYNSYNRKYVVDIETDGLKVNDSILSIGLYWNDELNYEERQPDHDRGIIIKEHLLSNDKVKDLLKDILYNNGLVLQNGKFDLRFMCEAKNCKFDLSRLKNEFDTMIAHMCIDERVGTHGMKEWAKNFFNAPDWEEDIKKYLPNKDSSYRLIPEDILNRYLKYDLKYTMDGYHLFRQLVRKEGTDSYFRFLQEAINIFSDIEHYGVNIDTKKLNEVKKMLDIEFEAASTKFEEEAVKIGWSTKNYFNETSAKTEPDAINVNSPLQLAYICYDLVNRDLKRQGKKEIELYYNEKEKAYKKSCCKEAVNENRLVHPVWEALAAVKDTSEIAFIDKIIKEMFDGKIRTSFNLAVATGRISSQGFNLQNLKRGSQVKNLLLPDKDSYILDVDYSSLEVFVAALLSNDSIMMEPFVTGGNFHSQTTENIFKTRLDKYSRLCVTETDKNVILEEVKKDTMLTEAVNYIEDEKTEIKHIYKIIFGALRQKSKAVTFGVLYSRGAESLARQELNCTVEEAQEFIDNFYDKYYMFAQWSDKQKEFALKNGYVTTWFGHKRRFPFIYYGNKAEVERQAPNTVIQGTAAQICLNALKEIWGYLKDLKLKSRILFTVHDSIVLSVHKTEVRQVTDMVIQIMNINPIKKEYKIEVEADIGLNYGNTKTLVCEGGNYKFEKSDNLEDYQVEILEKLAK